MLVAAVVESPVGLLRRNPNLALKSDCGFGVIIFEPQVEFKSGKKFSRISIVLVGGFTAVL